MSKPAHSKAPWKRTHGTIGDRYGNFITRDVSAGEVVCRMDASTMMAFEREANIRLIEKAPELREIVNDMAEGRIGYSANDMAKINALLRYIDKG